MLDKKSLLKDTELGQVSGGWVLSDAWGWWVENERKILSLTTDYGKQDFYAYLDELDESGTDRYDTAALKQKLSEHFGIDIQLLP